MTAKPPSGDPAKDEASVPPDSEPPRDEDEGRSASTARVTALAGGVVVGAVVIALLLFDSDGLDPAPGEGAGPEQGVACPFLHDAFEEFEIGNETAFAKALRIAARKAELTLERSGEVFGDPERIAVELNSDVTGSRTVSMAKIEKSLEDAQQACTMLARWPTST